MHENASFQQMYEASLRFAENLCGIITTPIEYALRPQFGTRYFEPIQMIATVMLMLLLPLFGKVANMLPFGNGFDQGGGYLGLGTFSLLFFIGSAIHAPRLWRRIFHMELEQHSRYEGETFSFFTHLPLGTNFWFVRVVWEPVLVALVAAALRFVLVIDRPAMIYLLVCALALLFKNYLSWYQSWVQRRNLMDTKFLGPLMAKAMAGKATERELAQVHMAGFAGTAPPEITAAAISQMASRMPALPADVAPAPFAC